MAYFPNGSAGEILDEQCDDCPLGYGWNDPKQATLFDVEREPRHCPVQLVQHIFNYKQVEPGNEELRSAMNLLIDERGTCNVRQQLVEIRTQATE